MFIEYLQNNALRKAVNISKCCSLEMLHNSDEPTEIRLTFNNFYLIAEYKNGDCTYKAWSELMENIENKKAFIQFSDEGLVQVNTLLL